MITLPLEPIFGVGCCFPLVRKSGSDAAIGMAQEDRWKFWSRKNDVDEQWIQYVDNNVLAGE